MTSMFRLSGSAPACSGSESTQDLPFSAQIKAAAAPLGDQNKTDDRKITPGLWVFRKDITLHRHHIPSWVGYIYGSQNVPK
jgi:hypothetical protein